MKPSANLDIIALIDEKLSAYRAAQRECDKIAEWAEKGREAGKKYDVKALCEAVKQVARCFRRLAKMAVLPDEQRALAHQTASQVQGDIKVLQAMMKPKPKKKKTVYEWF